MLKRVLLVALLASPLVAQTALAQKILYKSTMPNGDVIFGDKPAPGAAKVESLKPDTSKQGIVPPSAREKETLQTLETSRMQREGQTGRVPAAQKTLAAAEAARAAGQEPLENERIGTAGGASRLNDAYWERQKKLEAAVEKARLDLQNAQAGK